MCPLPIKSQNREVAMEGREGDQMEDNEVKKPSPVENGDSIEENLRELVENDEADFNTWTSLISKIEETSHSCVESIRKVYDAFLLEFPLCFGYWKKYASHVACYCTLNEVEDVYKRGVEAVPYCVDLWASYCSFGMLAYEDPADVRRLFERGLSFVGKDYSSYLLWDKYIEFEHSQKQWSRLAYVYINALRFPTKNLDDYYMSFKKLVAIWEEEMGCEKSISMDTGSDSEKPDGEACGHAEIMNVIRSLIDLQDGVPSPNTVKKYLLIGELLYHSSSQIVEKIKFYEDRIRRPYFHLKPLDKCQLETWHQYLDFVEMQGDFDWTVKLYERCLIPCANYSELWIRYVEFVEAKGGREIANNALSRAQKVFFKRMPAFHLYCSMFKEKIGDIDGARASFQSHRELDPKFIENVDREANMEKRMGNTKSACMVYEKAVELVQGKQNLHILSVLYIKFARFKFVVSNDIDAAIEVFMRGIQQVPCKYLVEEMVNFIALRGGPEQIPKLDSIIADVIAPELAVSEALNFSDREEISSLFLEVVDLHGTIHEVKKAWNRHRKLFPHIMKPVVECHPTRIRDKPLVKGVMGSKHMFISDSHQTCGDDGHDGSITHFLDYQSHEDNHIPPISMAAGQLPDSIIDNKGIEEPVEVTEDVEKQSINDNMGMEELVESTENAEKQSIPEGIDEYVEVAVGIEKQLTHDEKEGEEWVEVAEDVEKMTIPEGPSELHEAAREPANECQAVAQVPETTESGDGLRPPVLENLSIASPHNEIQSNPTASCDHNIPNEGKSDEISAIHVSDPLDTKSSTPSQVQIYNSPLHSVCESTPPEYQSNPPVQMQAREHSTQQQVETVNAAYSQNTSSVGNLPQMYYVQPSQPQQWQVHPQLQYIPTGTTSTQMVVAQGYPYQSQASQMASAQVYQGVQQQTYAYVQPQSSTQTQTQLSQQSILSNDQQYGYSQNSQGIPPHILQYYQQQYYYLQQHNQQIQNVQQCQQLLYMQQQQQQQLYQQQQQHYYVQQQQIIQQQQFQQLTQQEQQLLLQQHQQQFLQHMQQQYLLLQQQHQQQLQQLQQQSVQQHQQISGSDLKALSCPNVQQSLSVQQHSTSSNQGGPEHIEPAITSQREGDKLQSAEQSGTSIPPNPHSSSNQ